MEKETPSTAGDSSSNPTRVDLFSDETVDCIYQAKAHVLNQAIQKIGMGKYQVSCRINYAFLTGLEFVHQWYLFAVAGFGWVAYVFIVPAYRPTLTIFACFRDTGVFVCPLSTYELSVRRLWPPCKVLFANILYPVQVEYQFNPPLLSLAMGLGFFVGALFWGFSSDIWGRRCVFPRPLIFRDNLQ